MDALIVSCLISFIIFSMSMIEDGAYFDIKNDKKSVLGNFGLYVYKCELNCLS